jgi:hypothetical protein
MSAMQTNYLLACHQINSIWEYVVGNPYVTSARNRLATDFLTKHKNATDIFFLDDDIGWPAAAALKFLQRDEDVIAGAYPKKTDSQVEFPVEIATENSRVVCRDGLYKAALVPTGFLRIKRHVMEACAADSGIYTDLDSVVGSVDCWDIFRTGFVANEVGSRRGRWWGEDFFFSVMCRNLGFEIWLDPDINFSHHGTKAWKGNFAPHLQEWIEANRAPAVAEAAE